MRIHNPLDEPEADLPVRRDASHALVFAALAAGVVFGIALDRFALGHAWSTTRPPDVALSEAIGIYRAPRDDAERQQAFNSVARVAKETTSIVVEGLQSADPRVARHADTHLDQIQAIVDTRKVGR